MVRDFVIPPATDVARGQPGGDIAREPWAYLFPIGFRLHTYLRHKVWHCAADLPFPLDVQRDVCRRRLTT
jgi:hypothetical protein